MAPTAEAVEQPIEREFDVALQEALLDHPGKWAAVTRSDIIAVGDSPAEVLGLAHEAGHAEVILHRIPDDSHTAYFF